MKRYLLILALVALCAGCAETEVIQPTDDAAGAEAADVRSHESTGALWKLAVLGVVQGLTEFLPVSSSGHLALAEHQLGFKEAGVAGVIFLHLATTLALIVFFAPKLWRILASLFRRGEERRMNLRLVLFIAVGTVPAAVVGLFAREPIYRIFERPAYVSVFLLGTGLVLLLTRWAVDRGRSMGLSDAILVGIAQAVAILPGFSRSGLTIATALLLGIGSIEAFEFSFLLSLPAVLAANLLELKEIGDFAAQLATPLPLVLGFAASFGVGLLALWVLRRLVVSRRFWMFSFYCFAVGIAGLVIVFAFG